MINTKVKTLTLPQMLINTVNSADVNINSHKLINVTDPISASDGATKNFVDT